MRVFPNGNGWFYCINPCGVALLGERVEATRADVMTSRPVATLEGRWSDAGATLEPASPVLGHPALYGEVALRFTGGSSSLLHEPLHEPSHQTRGTRSRGERVQEQSEARQRSAADPACLAPSHYSSERLHARSGSRSGSLAASLQAIPATSRREEDVPHAGKANNNNSNGAPSPIAENG